MDLNNKNEIKCVGYKNWRKQEIPLGTIRSDKIRVYATPNKKNKEEIGPFYNWEEAAKALCPVVCGNCPSRRKK